MQVDLDLILVFDLEFARRFVKQVFDVFGFCKFVV